MNKVFIVFILTVLFLSTASADWKAAVKKDDFTEKVESYIVYSNSKHRIQISRQSWGAVWMFITRKELGSFEPNTNIELKVDKHKTNNIHVKTLISLGEAIGHKAYQWEPDTVGFLIWHGQEKEKNPCSKLINEMLKGVTLKGRYWISSVDRDTFSIPLEGAKKALIKGLKLNKCSS